MASMAILRITERSALPFGSGVEGQHVTAAVVAAVRTYGVRHFLGTAALAERTGRQAQGQVCTPLALASLGCLPLRDCHRTDRSLRDSPRDARGGPHRTRGLPPVVRNRPTLATARGREKGFSARPPPKPARP